MKLSQDELRYKQWKQVIESTKGKRDRSDINTAYLEQLNKCVFSPEFDDCLDAIIESEKSRKKYVSYGK